MTKVVPSQVVELIDESLPAARDRPTERIRVGVEYAPQISAIVNLAREIPSELIQLSGSDYADLVLGLNGLENIISTWRTRGAVNVPWEVRGISLFVLVRRALAKCPDESPAPATTDLPFIADEDLRRNIRRDISAANSALHNGEWKAATVLAGSATEALLLWGIQNKKAKFEVTATVDALVEARKLNQPRNNNPENWGLHEYIEIAFHLQLIEHDSATQARLAKDFRNLIHPGRAARLGQTCDRATALSAIAAVEHVVRDLLTM